MATPATAWAVRGNLKGPTGATGPTGPAGPTGPTGATGAAGADGGTTPHAARHAVGGADPVSPASIGAIDLALRGAASGVASLDSGSKVPVAQLPDLSATYIATSRLDVSGGIPVLTGTVLPRKYQQYATATLDGTVVLTGDLGGTATAPTVPGLATKAALVHTHAGADITSGTVAYARLPVGTAASTIAAGDDARFTSAVAYSRLPVGSAASTVAAGNDTRLSDARTPLAHVHSGADITSGTVAYARLPVGVAASTVAAGDDARFTSAVAYARLPVGTAASTVAAGDDARITGAEQAANKGAVNGYAGLDAGGDVPVAQLPTNVANGVPQLDVNGVIPQNRMYAASTATYGQILLAGDLGGTGALPTVPGLAGKLDALGPISTKTVDYTLTDADGTVVFDPTSGNRTGTLPTPVGRSGKQFTIKKKSGAATVPNSVTIATLGGSIDGAPTEVISVAGGFRTFESDGVIWHIIGGAVFPVIQTLANVGAAGAVTIDASIASVYRVTIASGACTLPVPTNPIDGDQINVEITATAAATMAPNAAIVNCTGVTAPFAIPAGKTLYLGLRWRSTGWRLLAYAIEP